MKRALAAIDYAGWLSAEVFPDPDALTAARMTVASARAPAAAARP